MKVQLMIILSIAVLFTSCRALLTRGTSPFLKSIQNGDNEINRNVHFDNTHKRSHSLFYSYKKCLLNKLKTQDAEQIFFIESLDLSSGIIYGTTWCSKDSLSYSFNGSELLYEENSPFSYVLKKSIDEWGKLDCPHSGKKKEMIHKDNYVFQRYSRNGGYKICYDAF